SVSVLLNTGNGTFAAPATYSLGDDSRPTSVAAGDFDGDGHVDLVVANYGADDIAVLRNNGDGTFGPATSFLAGEGRRPAVVATADLNGDGRRDLVLANSITGSVSVMFNQTPANIRPVANAGPSQTVVVGSLVTLNGTGSSDPDRGPGPLSFSWIQTAGPSVVLTGATGPTPSFTPTAPGVFSFQLVVGDGRANSGPSTVTITVVETPVAERCSILGNDPKPSLLDQDVFSFTGARGERVTIRLEKKGGGVHEGDRAVLILLDRVRNVVLARIDGSDLPNQISATLPAAGEYLIAVAELPKFLSGKRFRGDYCLRLQAGPATSASLRPTGSVEP
ncbi:MAG: FG-GAP-like repeat-containing protein, partial [Candidatus Rokuibacteriota bacterium]